MNNAKVRIYELSRELNLDNRDLLAICEQLNISVKSHSSTITEDEAERIRAAAAKYTANQPPSTKSSPTRPSANSQPAEIRKKTPLNIQKKQQILEIRRPITRSMPEQQPELKVPPTPQVSAAYTHPSPVRPVESSRLAAHSESEPDIEISDALVAPAESIVETTAPDISKAPVEALQPEISAVTQKPSVPTIAIELVEEKPLSQPPARPAATASRPLTTTKPLLKRDKTVQPSGVTERLAENLEQRLNEKVLNHKEAPPERAFVVLFQVADLPKSAPLRVRRRSLSCAVLNPLNHLKTLQFSPMALLLQGSQF